MELNLNAGDRINLMNLLPREGNMLTLGLTKDIRGKVEIDTKEAEKIDLKMYDTNGGQAYSWDDKKDKGKKISFTDAEAKVIKDQARKLDEEGKVPMHYYELFKKILS